jgi:hypothetical protein
VDKNSGNRFKGKNPPVSASIRLIINLQKFVCANYQTVFYFRSLNRKP